MSAKNNGSLLFRCAFAHSDGVVAQVALLSYVLAETGFVAFFRQKIEWAISLIPDVRKLRDRDCLRCLVQYVQSIMSDAELTPALDHWLWRPGILDLDARVIVHASS